MEPANEPTKLLNSTFVYSVVLNRTTGTLGYPLLNILRTPGPPLQPRKPHSIYSLVTPHKYISQPER